MYTVKESHTLHHMRNGFDRDSNSGPQSRQVSIFPLCTTLDIVWQPILINSWPRHQWPCELQIWRIDTCISILVHCYITAYPVFGVQTSKLKSTKWHILMYMYMYNSGFCNGFCMIFKYWTQNYLNILCKILEIGCTNDLGICSNLKPYK
jgi:hypothetical protein